MRRITAVFLILFTIAISSGCGGNTKENVQNEPIKPVNVIEVGLEAFPINLEYIGSIEATEIKKYSFKLPGKITMISKDKGEKVNFGDILAQQDQEDVDLARKAAENDLKKVRKAYDFYQDNLNNLKLLFESGAIAKQEYDKAKLELDILEQDFNNAQIDYENKRNMQKDTKLIALDRGIVTDLLYKEGEIVGGGYPVVIVRDDKLKAVAGFSQQDVTKLKVGQAAQVFVNGILEEGTISYINELPDSTTRTYNVEIELKGNDFPIGALAKITITIGGEEGILIPITSILSNGEDYVFVVNENRVEKRTVKLGRISGTKVIVQGLAPGEKVVIEGITKLKDGDKVTVQ